ncbi:MAG TPA: YncE family protein [Paludibacteraceae bacterium]|nr:YncE family protein [Paludibacteraceae bacterium]
MKRILFFLSTAGCIFLASCRGDYPVIPPTETPINDTLKSTTIAGFYLLNEGNMGSNKATLDYYDYTTRVYTKNIFAATNPNVVAELGDVGNDLKIYGNKLYAVINCSNLVEIMDARTAKHLGMVEIANCRYIAFSGGKAYVSSYAGPVQLNPNRDQIGYIAEIDTATFQITRTVTVGYQPEELAVVNGKLYVANSGGYRYPNYDKTVSVIDLATFTEIKQIPVAINLHRLKADRHGRIYISARGDYYSIPSNLYIIDTSTDTLQDSLNIPVSNFCIEGDSAYIYSTQWNWNTGETTITYAIINLATKQVVNHHFMEAATEEKIKTPYGIAVNPETREIFVTDAKNHVTPGTLYCFSPDGKLKWEVTTGDIPAHFAFLYY